MVNLQPAHLAPRRARSTARLRRSRTCLTNRVRIDALVNAPAPESLRLDKALWQLRLTRTRGLAQALIAAGHVRVDGRRVDKPAALVRAGCVLTLPLPAGVRVIRILDLPLRRGPPTEAAACYVDLDSDSTPPK
jgi:ribosomal 50S subunit-recycling heat shock protein